MLSFTMEFFVPRARLAIRLGLGAGAVVGVGVAESECETKRDKQNAPGTWKER